MCQTTKVKLLVQSTDSLDYTTYVFEILDKNERERLGTYYLMCVRWPNWDHRQLKNGEIGFLNFEEVFAGHSRWYDGKTFHFYKTDNIQFIKFINEQPDKKHSLTL